MTHKRIYLDGDGIFFHAIIHFPCPECEQYLSAKQKFCGKELPCCNCGSQIVVPTRQDAARSEQIANSEELQQREAGRRARQDVKERARSLKQAKKLEKLAFLERQSADRKLANEREKELAQKKAAELEARRLNTAVAIPPIPRSGLNLPPQGKRFCSNCGGPHNANQAVCLKCGVAIPSIASGYPKSGNKDKNVAGILALLLGPLGVHHFYHGSWGKGLVYVLCTLTIFGAIITSILAFIEALIYFCGSDEKYDMKFNQTPPSPFK